ncbi:MAG: Rne/Rng family ribonuclease [Gammaproteobacteria bacterium]|nr:Rne/Rng family ribonuclease [Gammaproteobacteria bacterium]
MAEELLINVSEFETRVALLQGGATQELHLARSGGYSLTGNIYVGQVVRIIPGMQAAFVNIGLRRPGFLHARDIEGSRLILQEETRKTSGNPELNENAAPREVAASSEEPALPEATVTRDIRELLHEGQELMVQVVKDPIASKGARLTTQLTVASRYMVLVPDNDHIGISRRIDEVDERERLQCVIESIRDEQCPGRGFIARTAAEGVSPEIIDMDVKVLVRMWDKILARKRDVNCPGIIYQEIPLHIRVVRDLASPSLERIYIDHEETFAKVRSFVADFLPEFNERLVHYNESRALFDRFGVEDEIDRALDQKVMLKSGGYLVIEQTEAMITIDVNTGAYLGVNSLEETVFRTNLEAAQAIPRQLRLRNLGGIIVIDFIDMEQEEHQRQVMRVLEKACESDGAKIRLDGFSSLGLVQMSRKRTRESLAQQICEPCDHCSGLGSVKTPQSTCIEVFRAVLQDFKQRCEPADRESEYMIRAPSPVVDRLLDEDAHHLAELARLIGRDVRIQVEPSYAPGQFDILLVLKPS